jgi:damage-control phosphatase, subfamily I
MSLSSEIKLQADCMSCILQQTLRVSRVATENDWLHRRAIIAVLKELQGIDFSTSPAEVLSGAVATALKTLGAGDPMSGEREKLRIQLGPLVDYFQNEIAAEASIEVAIRAAASANLVDQCALKRFDLVTAIKAAFQAGFACGRQRMSRVLERIEKARQIVYLLDNAGEADIDLLLVKQLVKRGKKVTLVVKSAGLLHDVTMNDLEAAHPKIETGSSLMGAQSVLCSEEFAQAMAQADFVIAKGSANYETFEPGACPVLYLLTAKCSVIARELGIKKGQVAMIFADVKQKV